MAVWDDNPILNASKARYEQQPHEVQSILDKIQDINYEKYQLQVIKKKRPRLEKGDLFLLNPFGNVYFYGVVLNADISNVMGHGLITICIFKKYTHSIQDANIHEVFTKKDILLKPSTVIKAYWTNGYFYNIGRVETLPEINYGFYDMAHDIYVDDFGKKLSETPNIATYFSLVTMEGVVWNLYYELVIDHSFLSQYDQIDFKEHMKKTIASASGDEVPLSEFEQSIVPFVFSEDSDQQCSVSLTAFDDFKELFTNHSVEIEGNGYDWEAVIKSFLKMYFPKECGKLRFDSEAGMFYMYCSDQTLLKRIVTEIVKVIQDGRMEEHLYAALEEV